MIPPDQAPWAGRGINPTSVPPSPVTPTSAAPLFAAPTSPAAIPMPPGPADEASTEDGLPRRVRQANLVPQLRRPAGAPQTPPDDEVTAPLRSPEQMRSIMSALQRGTTRGRIDAAREAAEHPVTNGRHGAHIPTESEDRSNAEDSDDHGRVGGTSFADAATVSFPAIVDVTLGRGETSTGGSPAGADDDPERNDVTRPEKDA